MSIQIAKIGNQSIEGRPFRDLSLFFGIREITNAKNTIVRKSPVPNASIHHSLPLANKGEIWMVKTAIDNIINIIKAIKPVKQTKHL